MHIEGGASNSTPPPLAGGAPAAARLHPHIKVLTRHDELPNYTRVLSAPGGELAASESQRKVFAILDLGAKQVCVVWTNLFADRTHYMWVKAQCERAAMGYHIVETMEASPDLIELFYSAASNENVRASTSYRGRADEVFDQIVAASLEEDASDIHWQVDEAVCNIFFRIHGQMKFHKSFPRDVGESLSRAAFTFTDEQSRSGVAAFNERETLGASMTREVMANGKSTRVKLRWESHPSYPDGWDITQRLLRLGQDSGKLDFAKLGYSDAQIAAIVQAYQARVGLILMVGATGSGKSTTLSTMAGKWLEYHQNRKKLMTIEDPVEYVIKGARQINVTSRINKDGSVTGVGFEAALRTALRSDPDAIEVGEIRSEQTAELVQHAVDTGHLVLSTVHAKSPFGAVGRLLEMGMSSSVIADEGFLRLIIYQALIPKLCEACRRPWEEARAGVDPIAREQVERHFHGHLHGIYIQNEGGCPRCKHMGVAGRTAVAEMLVPDREIRNLIPSFKIEGSGARLMAYSYWRAGMSTLASEVQGKTCMDQAMEKVRAGIACPLNVQKELGLYDDQTKPHEEKAYYERLRASLGVAH